MTDDHTTPDPTASSVAGAGDGAASTPDNFFDDAPVAPVAPVDRDGSDDRAGPSDGPADDTTLLDGAAAVPPAGDDRPGLVDDIDDGPDWERLAAEDPRTSGELLRDLVATAGSRDEYLDSLQRKQAEFENFRRRMQQQSAQQRVAGHADVAGRVLEVLDDFDRTLASIATTADEGVVKGVSLVRDKLMGALREVGLERVDDTGAAFDPNRHEAVQQVSGDGIVEAGGEPVVAEVLRPGYVLGTRVLRAAMVAVAQ